MDRAALFRRFLKISLVVAAVGPIFVALSYVSGNHFFYIFGKMPVGLYYRLQFIFLSLALAASIAWLAMLIGGVVTFRGRGLWLLLEAPFGLLGAGTVISLVQYCRSNTCFP